MALALDEIDLDRLADVRQWLRSNPLALDDRTAYLAIISDPFPSALDNIEALIRAADPTGLPARCEDPSCRRRLPMCQRSDRWHPKCEPVF